MSNNSKIYEVKEIDDILYQKCVKCLSFKTFDLFGKNKENSNGISRYCKQCKSEKDKEDYKKHKKNKREKNKLYYEKNKLIIGNLIKEKRKIDENFKLKEKERSKNWREKNKDTIHKKKKEYYEKNKKKIHKQMLLHRWSDINVRIKQNLRSRIWHALKNGNKKEHFSEIIGCSTEDLKSHLEKQFKGGMSWENYGKEWHIDHIKPCCQFNMTLEEHRRECFNYKNLQPL